MRINLNEALALVTGASGGLGARFARVLAELDGVLLRLVAEESQFINAAIFAADDGMSVA